MIIYQIHARINTHTPHTHTHNYTYTHIYTQPHTISHTHTLAWEFRKLVNIESAIAGFVSFSRLFNL